MTCMLVASEPSASNATTRRRSNVLGRTKGRRQMLRGHKHYWSAARVLCTLTVALLLSICFAPSASAVQRTQFDHLTTGYELQGAHRDLSCEFCHQRGVFKGTPRTCVGCHTTGSRISSTARPITHIPTTD